MYVEKVKDNGETEDIKAFCAFPTCFKKSRLIP